MLHSKEKYNLILQIREWIKLFLLLANSRKGYANRNVTPYMHAAAYHLQDVIDRFGSVKHFSGQGTVSVTGYFNLEQTTCMASEIIPIN